MSTVNRSNCIVSGHDAYRHYQDTRGYAGTQGIARCWLDGVETRGPRFGLLPRQLSKWGGVIFPTNNVIPNVPASITQPELMLLETMKEDHQHGARNYE